MSDRVRAKKSLGQHFLANRAVAFRIVGALSGEAMGQVIEIDPGMGVLTGSLLERFGDRLKVVEIDGESVAYLGEHFPALEGRILHEDFLRLDLARLGPGPFSVIGNFPYNISSQILFHLLSYRDQVHEIVGMFQREVARRIVSGPGSKEYGILSVLMGAYFKGEYLFTVDENEFRPPPKVKSGVVRFVRNDTTSLICKPETLHRVVKMAFNQRRKTLRNALSAIWSETLEDSGLGSLRAEQLGVAEFAELGRRVELAQSVLPENAG